VTSHREGPQVHISREPQTGNVIQAVMPPASTWRDFMVLRDQLAEAPEDFLADRVQNIETRDTFADWSE
jgi:hypothetical protein